MIKRLDLTHVDKILDLEKEYKDGFKRKVLISSFNNPNFFVFGIYDNLSLIGTVSFSYQFEQGDIESVFVLKEYRKKGVASSLLSFSIDYLKDKVVNKIFLEVREGNIPAISLYKKFGFKSIKIRERYYSDGENAVIMSLGE